MKPKNALIRGLFILPIFVLLLSAQAFADCHMDSMKSCYSIEKNRPDSSRGGLDATKFCAAEAIIDCKSRQSSHNYGYSDESVRELDSYGVSPAEARAIEKVCGSACK